MCVCVCTEAAKTINTKLSDQITTYRLPKEIILPVVSNSTYVSTNSYRLRMAIQKAWSSA